MATKAMKLGGYNVISTKLAKITKIYFFETTRNEVMIPE